MDFPLGNIHSIELRTTLRVNVSDSLFIASRQPFSPKQGRERLASARFAIESGLKKCLFGCCFLKQFRTHYRFLLLMPFRSLKGLNWNHRHTAAWVRSILHKNLHQESFWNYDSFPSLTSQLNFTENFTLHRCALIVLPHNFTVERNNPKTLAVPFVRVHGRVKSAMADT